VALSEIESELVSVFGFGWFLLAGPSKLIVMVQDSPRDRALGQLFV
jgi:hypothetical protein